MTAARLSASRQSESEMSDRSVIFASPICPALQRTLTNYNFLQPSLATIAEDCDRGTLYISMEFTAADFGK